MKGQSRSGNGKEEEHSERYLIGRGREFGHAGKRGPRNQKFQRNPAGS